MLARLCRVGDDEEGKLWVRAGPHSLYETLTNDGKCYQRTKIIVDDWGAFHHETHELVKVSIATYVLCVCT